MTPQRHRIDLSAYPRRGLFEAFKDRQQPCFGTTCQVDVTAIRRFARDRGYGFFVTMSYVLARVVNQIPALKHRLIDGELWEMERVDPGYTVLLEDETFSFCDAVYIEHFADYHADAQRRIAAVTAAPDTSTGEKHQMFFITSIPWLSFTAFTHPFDPLYASIPIVTLGRYFDQGDSLLMPLAMQVHHGLVDGYHVGCFYERVQAICRDPGPVLDDKGIAEA